MNYVVSPRSIEAERIVILAAIIEYLAERIAEAADRTILAAVRTDDVTFRIKDITTEEVIGITVRLRCSTGIDLVSATCLRRTASFVTTA